MEERNEQATEEMAAEEKQAEEAVIEETVTADETADESNELQEKVMELEAKLSETENRALRLQADFDNYRRRVQLDREAAEKYKAQSLVLDILPALDNFERAMKVEVNDEQAQSLLQGMEMIHRQLVEALVKEGVEAIEAVGQPFDPYLHQAVMQVEDSSYESNTVVEEFQKGYKLKDRVIRPAMVKVNQ
ncbi:nucleotide exchange factor GrpE [Ectobacillus panaciterrae]|uniref:nucleotide exchange factor GrpE n=1 Tax=Ectobacillus panaciterrae TaxID=363872 RepID=UPI0004234669